MYLYLNDDKDDIIHYTVYESIIYDVHLSHTSHINDIILYKYKSVHVVRGLKLYNYEMRVACFVGVEYLYILV